MKNTIKLGCLILILLSFYHGIRVNLIFFTICTMTKQKTADEIAVTIETMEVDAISKDKHFHLISDLNLYTIMPCDVPSQFANTYQVE